MAMNTLLLTFYLKDYNELSFTDLFDNDIIRVGIQKSIYEFNGYKGGESANKYRLNNTNEEILKG